MNNLPSLTHLQFLVLDLIGDGLRKGGQIMQALKEHEELRAGSAFYQLMTRLENSGFVQSQFQDTVYKGRFYREKLFKLTGAGRKAHDEVLAFYSHRKSLT